MSAPGDDGTDPVLRKYAPKWSRERPTAPDVERQQYVNLLQQEHQDRRIRSLLPEPVSEPPARLENGLLPLMARFVRVAVFAIVVALLAVLGKPLLQRVGLLEPDSRPIQISKPADPRLTANDAPANMARAPAAGIAAAPVAAPSATAQAQQMPPSAQVQQAALSPTTKPFGEETIVGTVNSAVRGITDSDIRFGISAPFTGP